MKFIGITGGVGAGKTEVLKYLKEHCNCRIIVADELAHELREPGGVCHEQILALLGRDILSSDGSICRSKMAEKIFSDKSLLDGVNNIIHPAVKERILEIKDEEEKKRTIDFLFLEAALLIDDGYDKICDELWYIFVRDEVRKQRLRESRGYSEEKTDSILRSQRSDEDFRKYCKWTIDNSDEFEITAGQLDLLIASKA